MNVCVCVSFSFKKKRLYERESAFLHCMYMHVYYLAYVYMCVCVCVSGFLDGIVSIEIISLSFCCACCCLSNMPHWRLGESCDLIGGVYNCLNVKVSYKKPSTYLPIDPTSANPSTPYMLAFSHWSTSQSAMIQENLLWTCSFPCGPRHCAPPLSNCWLPGHCLPLLSETSSEGLSIIVMITTGELTLWFHMITLVLVGFTRCIR